MIIPVKCFTCGKVIASVYNKYRELMEAGLKIIHKNKKLVDIPSEEISATQEIEENTINDNHKNLFIADSIHKHVFESNDALLISDYNYVFLNQAKDEELMLMNV